MKRKTARFQPSASMEERRLQILLDAAACFAKHGFHATSMREICKAAKLSAGAMYHYFASKDDIIAAMIAMDRQRTTAAFASMPEGAGVVEVLRHLVITTTADCHSQGMLCMWTEMTAEVSRNDRLRPLFVEYYHEIHAKLTSLLKAAAKRGELRAELKPAETAAFVMAVYDGVMCRCAVDKSADFLKISEQALSIIALLLSEKPDTKVKRGTKGGMP
jgi:TetR/AcrR family transcriptional regulator, repressor for uid operon